MEGRLLVRNNCHRRKNISRFAFQSGPLVRDKALNLSSLMDAERLKLAETNEKREKSYNDAAEVAAKAEQELRQHQAMKDAVVAVHKVNKVTRQVSNEQRRFVAQALTEHQTLEAFNPDKNCKDPPDSDKAYKSSKVFKLTGLHPEIIRKVKDKEVQDLDEASMIMLNEALFELAKDHMMQYQIKKKVTQAIASNPAKAKYRQQMEQQLYAEALGKRAGVITKELRDGRDERDYKQKLAESEQEIAKLREQNRILQNNKELIDLDKAKRAVIEEDAKVEAQQHLDIMVQKFDKKLKEMNEKFNKELSQIEHDKLVEIEHIKDQHNKTLALFEKENELLSKSLTESNRKRKNELDINPFEQFDDDDCFDSNPCDIQSSEEEEPKKKKQRIRRKEFQKREMENELAMEEAKMNELLEKRAREKRRNRRSQKDGKRTYVTTRKRNIKDEVDFSSSDEEEHFSCDDKSHIKPMEYIKHKNAVDVNYSSSDDNPLIETMEYRKSAAVSEDIRLRNEISDQFRDQDGKHLKGFLNGRYCCNKYFVNTVFACYNWVKCCGPDMQKKPTHIPDKFRYNQQPYHNINLRKRNNHHLLI